MKPLGEAAAALGVHLSPSQIDLLAAYERLLLAKAIPAGHISAFDAPRLRERHILDSLAAAPLFGEGDRASVDLGSGAGLPGVVLAIALPHVRFALVESRSRRAGFIELAVQELGLGNAEVLPMRVEHAARERPRAYDVATARAFAPIPEAWAAAHLLLRSGGRMIYFAGRSAPNPEAVAHEATSPDPPADVSVTPVLDSPAQLVIMSRT